MKKYFVGASLLAVMFLVAACDTNPVPAERRAEIAQCLTDNDIKMYGAFWCPHCQDQKKLFGDEFSDVEYVECDERGENPRPALCQEAGIQSYPTWIINDKPITGAQDLETLALLAGC